jgi:hypothetical protein
MAETVELIAQLNDHWTLVYLSNPAGSRYPAWLIRKAGDDRAGAIFRAKHMVIEYITFIVAKDGTIDPAAVEIMGALPDRCDRDPARQPAPKYERKRPAKAAAIEPGPNPPPADLHEPSPGFRPAAPTPEVKAERLAVIRATAKRLKRLDERAAP